MFTSDRIKDLPSGVYAEVVSLTHATYVWEGSGVPLDPTGNDGDVDGDWNPDESVTGASTTTAALSTSTTDTSVVVATTSTVELQASEDLEETEQFLANLNAAMRSHARIDAALAGLISKDRGSIGAGSEFADLADQLFADEQEALDLLPRL